MKCANPQCNNEVKNYCLPDEVTYNSDGTGIEVKDVFCGLCRMTLTAALRILQTRQQEEDKK